MSRIAKLGLQARGGVQILRPSSSSSSTLSILGSDETQPLRILRDPFTRKGWWPTRQNGDRSTELKLQLLSSMQGVGIPTLATWHWKTSGVEQVEGENEA